MTNREISLKRAEELKERAQPYLKIKPTIGYGLEMKNELRITASQKLILECLNASPGDFDDWTWQYENRFSLPDEMNFFFHFSEEEKKGVKQVAEKYRFSITPYYLSLINPDNEDDPIKKMSMVSVDELDKRGDLDPMLEEQTNPCGTITRRYPDRLIINVTNACAMFCRHCQRRRRIGETDHDSARKDIEASITYIRENEEIRDVLITGGDPLTLSDDFLDEMLGKIRAIPHVQIIRIGTRTPVTMPQRITPEFVSMLKKYHPLYINTQFNHPAEITKESRRACNLLADGGIPLGNQMVLLKGINNDKYVVRFLNEELLKIRVRPYYIFHPKNVTGTRHFYVSFDEGLAIMEYLRGNTSGLAVPTYIVNAPGGLGKIPLLPNYVVEKTRETLILKNWEGKTIEYPDWS